MSNDKNLSAHNRQGGSGAPRGVVRYVLGSLLAFVALNAFFGGYYGMAGAKGVPTEWLAGSPFCDYFIPGLILFVVVGGSFLIATIAVFARHRIARLAAFSAVVIVFGWLAVQIAIIGYVSWMQPATAIAGLFILILAWLLPKPDKEENLMSQLEPNQFTDAETADSRWKLLYKAGGAAALIMAVIIVIQFIVFIVSPPPLEGTAIDWFTLFQNNRLLGLLAFELLMIVYVILSIPIVLALYIALRQANQSLTVIYLFLSLVGIVAFIAARPAFEILSLSNHYAAATTEAQRAIFLAAGESMLAVFHGTAFYVSYVLGSINGLIISIVMLRSNIFSKSTAYVRIASSVLDFGLFVPTIGIFISLFSVVFLWIWDILIARRFFQLGQGVPKK